MPNVHLLTDTTTDMPKNTAKAYYFDAGSLNDWLAEVFDAKQIENLKQIQFDKDKITPLTYKNPTTGKSNPLYELGTKIAESMLGSYESYIKNSPNDIYFRFEHGTDHGLIVEYLIKDTIRVLRNLKKGGRYPVGLSGCDYSPINKAIAAAMAAILGSGDDDDDEDGGDEEGEEGEDEEGKDGCRAW